MQGNGQWTVLCSKSIDPNSSSLVTFTPKDKGEWIRISTDKTSVISATFVFAIEREKNYNLPLPFLRHHPSERKARFGRDVILPG